MSFESSVSEIRRRIEGIETIEIRRCFQASFLFCARIGEVISVKFPGDKTANPTGLKLVAVETVYVPDLVNLYEVQILMMRLLAMRGVSPSMEEIAKTKEPVALFTVSTEKRHGKERNIALPLNPLYEPWSKPLLDYFLERKKEGGSVFPFDRQKMWREARYFFKGFKCQIEGYRKIVKVDGQVQLNVKGKPQTVFIPEHVNPFGTHALRKLREDDLENNYGFDPIDISTYGGWTLRSKAGVSGSIDRYRTPRWQRYFAKLLKPISDLGTLSTILE